MPVQTALVLGAGASKVYGYPIGLELRRQIIAAGPDVLYPQMDKPDREEAREFLLAFNTSNIESIDRFVWHRPQFTQLASIAIAHQLLLCEHKSKLMRYQQDGHWYGHLVNKLASEQWGNFHPDWLSIVTFNYDRSLEAFLLTALCSAFGKPAEEVAERLKLMRWHHVYGSLGSPWPGDDYFEYGKRRQQSDDPDPRVREAAGRLRLMADSRIEQEHLIGIQQTLREAQRIAFLGFSFDKLNVKRIGGGAVFGTANHCKQLAATTINMKEREVRVAIASLLPAQVATLHYRDTFMDCGCEDLLREVGYLE